MSDGEEETKKLVPKNKSKKRKLEEKTMPLNVAVQQGSTGRLKVRAKTSKNIVLKTLKFALTFGAFLAMPKVGLVFF